MQVSSPQASSTLPLDKAMAHSKATFILALVWFNTACPAAGSSIMRVGVDAGGSLEMEQAASLSNLGHMFDDDTDAKAVISNAPVDSVDELLPFIQNLKKTLEPWAVDESKKLKTAAESITACNEGIDKGMLEAKDQHDTCDAKGVSHKEYRSDECEKFTTKEHWKAEKATRHEVMNTECDAFNAVKKEVKEATTSLSSYVDEMDIVDSVEKKFCSDLNDRYRDHQEKCKTAEAAAADASAEHEKATTAWTVQKTTSDTEQNAMFESCCEHAIATKVVCGNYDECWEERVKAYEIMKAAAEDEEKLKKVEWRVYSRIECLLPVLGTNKADEIEKCREKTHSTSHLDVEYPSIPEKAACEVETAFPGTPVFYNAHFANLPDTCKGQAVEMCPGMKQ